MKVAIRADASRYIGTGHVMRCLTLAKRVASNGGQVIFVSRSFPGNIIDIVESQGFSVKRLPDSRFLSSREPESTWPITFMNRDADETLRVLRHTIPLDWLIVDHYGLDARWERKLRSAARKVLAIDDLANRSHDADMLVDANHYKNPQTRYLKWVPRHCRVFVGPQYALVRKEFYQALRQHRVKRGPVRHILVFMGGGDPDNLTGRTITALREKYFSRIKIHVVVGKSNVNRKSIERECRGIRNFKFYCQVNNLASLMKKADLAIGAGGVSALERCCVGLPSAVIIIARNQLESTRSLLRKGCIVSLGWHKNITPNAISLCIRKLIQSPVKRLEMSRRSLLLMKNVQIDRNDPIMRYMRKSV